VSRSEPEDLERPPIPGRPGDLRLGELEETERKEREENLDSGKERMRR